VGAAGIELPAPESESPRIDAKSSETGPAIGPGATAGEDQRGPEAVPASPIAAPADTDDATFAAYKVAKAAGDVDSARALLDLLVPKRASDDAASVTPLSLVRGEGGRQ
jgi:hypothetical protein